MDLLTQLQLQLDEVEKAAKWNPLAAGPAMMAVARGCLAVMRDQQNRIDALERSRERIDVI